MNTTTLSGNLLEQVEAEIARLIVVRDMLRAAFNGTVAFAPDPAPKVSRAAEPTPVRRPGVGPTKAQVHADQQQRRMTVARHMLGNGPMAFSEVQRLLNKSAETTGKTLKCDWFRKQGDGRPGSAGQWELTAIGRGYAGRNGPVPFTVATNDGPVVFTPVAPPGESRHNPDLDRAFGADDLFMSAGGAKEPPAGKATPRPFGTNGTGAPHQNGTIPRPPVLSPEGTGGKVLRMLADYGKETFTRICSRMTTHPATVTKAMGQLEARGLIFKDGRKGHPGLWEITKAGLEHLARS